MISQPTVIAKANGAAVGVLLSGGIDSSILVGHLLDAGQRVQPFYIRSHLFWEPDELAAARRFLAAVARGQLGELIVLDLPLTDLYQDHWSVTGRDVPGAESPDEAVYLPGRNALLVIKAALWCQLHGVERLALAPLGTSPFADATPDFFDLFQSALNRGTAGQFSLGPISMGPVSILRPFAGLDKRQVMALGSAYPLHLTFSCIAPQRGRHCGRCNKCAERQLAFRLAATRDPTDYAIAPADRCASDGERTE